MTSYNAVTLMRFNNEAPFIHPSYNSSSGTFLQAVRKRNVSQLIKVFHYDFPDTAEFHGSMLDETVHINEAMEQYCKMILLLFYPYCQLSDLALDGYFTLRVRHAVATGKIGAKAVTFLQNMEDTRSNSFRLTGLYFVAKLMKRGINPTTDDESGNNDRDIEGDYLEQLLDSLGLEGDMADHVATEPHVLPQSVNLTAIRQKGVQKCGYESLAAMSMNDPQEIALSVLQVEEASTQSSELENAALTGNDGSEQIILPTQHDIVTVLLKRTSRRSITFQDIINSTEPINLLEANGSVRSILDWATKAKLDREQ